MPKINITIGDNAGATHTFETEMVMGRSPEADFLLNDLRSSRKHARIFKKDNDFYLEDLKSQNGTYLNGQRLQTEIKLKNNDSIRIGATWMVFAIDEESLAPGETFLGFKISQEVAQEATGNIYLAVQTALQRNILLWVLPAQSFQQQAEQAQQNFVKQISTVASLFHRNIMMLLDFAATKRYFYCAFEEIDFHANWKSFIKNSKEIALDLALEIAIQAAQGLAYVHQQNILHLHLTSKNMLIQPGTPPRVIITELGVSRFLSESSVGDSQSGSGILGLSEYIAPEQITGAATNHATDIYAYGCLVYHLLSGAPPFQASNASDLANMHMTQAPRPLSEIRKGLPDVLTSLVHRCLEKDPAKRYGAFAEIVLQLQTLQAERHFTQILHGTQGKTLLKQYFGEKCLLRWWVILPVAAIFLGLLIFFGLPLL